MDHNLPIEYLTAARREIAAQRAHGMDAIADRDIRRSELAIHGLGVTHGVVDALMLTGLAADCREAIGHLLHAIRTAKAADDSITHPETCK